MTESEKEKLKKEIRTELKDEREFDPYWWFMAFVNIAAAIGLIIIVVEFMKK